MEVKIFLLLSMCVASIWCWPVVETWNLNEIPKALAEEKHNAIHQCLEDALNDIMLEMYSGQEMHTTVLLSSPTGGKTWTMDQLKEAVSSLKSYPDDEEYIKEALQRLQYKQDNGINQDSIEVIVPAMDISEWNVSDVEEVKHSNKTIPNILLQQVETQLKVKLKNGFHKPSACLLSPFGVVPVSGVKKSKYIPRD